MNENEKSSIYLEYICINIRLYDLTITFDQITEPEE